MTLNFLRFKVLFLRFTYFYPVCVWVFYLHVLLCITCVCSARVPGSEWQLEAPMWVLKTEPRFLQWAISPALNSGSSSCLCSPSAGITGIASIPHFVLFFEKCSLCNPGWTGTYYVHTYDTSTWETETERSGVIYLVSLRPAWAVWDHLSKNKQTNK